jgi:hypothetical protein
MIDLYERWDQKTMPRHLKNLRRLGMQMIPRSGFQPGNLPALPFGSVRLGRQLAPVLDQNRCFSF